MEIQNAKITDTMLGYEDHGIFTCMLYLDYGGSCQGFGGYQLGKEYTDKHIQGIMKAVGVDKWEKLKGQMVRVKRDPGYGGKILAVGHILEDKWFNPVNV